MSRLHSIFILNACSFLLSTVGFADARNDVYQLADTIKNNVLSSSATNSELETIRTQLNDIVIQLGQNNGSIACLRLTDSWGNGFYNLVFTNSQQPISNFRYNSSDDCRLDLNTNRSGLLCSRTNDSWGNQYWQLTQSATGTAASQKHFGTINQCVDHIASTRQGLFCNPYIDSWGNSLWSIRSVNSLQLIPGDTQTHNSLSSCSQIVSSAKNGFICLQRFDNWGNAIWMIINSSSGQPFGSTRFNNATACQTEIP